MLRWWIFLGTSRRKALMVSWDSSTMTCNRALYCKTTSDCCHCRVINHHGRYHSHNDCQHSHYVSSGVIWSPMLRNLRTRWAKRANSLQASWWLWISSTSGSFCIFFWNLGCILFQFLKRGHRGEYCLEFCDPWKLKELDEVNTPVCEQVVLTPTIWCANFILTCTHFLYFSIVFLWYELFPCGLSNDLLWCLKSHTVNICEVFPQSGSFCVALENLIDLRQSRTGHIDGTFLQCG